MDISAILMMGMKFFYMSHDFHAGLSAKAAFPKMHSYLLHFLVQQNFTL